MALVKTSGARIAAICTCVPSRRFDNLTDSAEFSDEEIRKVTGMAGVASRRLAGDAVCSSDLCVVAAQRALDRLGWKPNSIDALILVTQTPDYFLPSTACVVHHRLGLADHCAAFDVGLGCSGYPYGMWLAAMMLQGGGVRRALVLHGETPTRFSDKADRSVSLLFGDAGSATALEAVHPGSTADWHYALHSDGSGYNNMIVESGGFRDRFGSDPRKHCVRMNGALYTGDLAKVDEDGFIYIVDRAKDFLKCRGEKVSCRQIEEVLLEFDELVEAAVIGIPDDVLGEAVKAFVVPRSRETNGLKERVASFCKNRMPQHHLPKQIFVLPSLPKSSSGKVMKTTLKGM